MFRYSNLALPANSAMHDDMRLAATERRRISEEYRRRSVEVRTDLYSPWRASEILSRTTRIRAAASLLRRAGVFPTTSDQCLEIGFGSIGWLGDLIGWGLRETDLHGIELDPLRAAMA